MALALHVFTQLVALRRAMTESEALAVSRGNGEQVAASELQSCAEALNQTLQAVLSAGLPDADPVVADANNLVKTVRDMVRPHHCACSDVGTHSPAKPH